MTPADTGLMPDQLEVCWRPSQDVVERSNLKRFMDRHGIGSYGELLRWSTADVTRFWDAVSEDLGLEWYQPYSPVLDVALGVEWPRWWVDGRCNYVHNALDKHARGDRRDQPALAWEGEDGATSRFTYAELFAEVNRCAHALRELGVRKGDRVALYLPMIPEVVIAQLALGKLGAIFSPIFSGFGADAIAARLQDCGAKLLVTCDGYTRRGKLVPAKEYADEAVAAAPSVESVLVVQRAGRPNTPWRPDRDAWWHDHVPRQSAEFGTESMDPEDPYMILYTSGSTGKPKGVLHVHGGFPIKGAQDMAHCFDVRSEDNVCWLTDMGWIMGPWLVSGALTLGATCVLFDGTPDYPDAGRLWEVVERHRISILGIAPTVVRSLMRAGDDWVTRSDLSSLRVLGATGEPWNPDPWRWFQGVVGGGRLPIINYSGGTECSGGIVCSNVLTPQKPTSFSGPVPGMDADVVDELGQPVRGQVGELVIRQPWPGITRGFWGDPDNERYLDSYWSRLAGIWVHGDWALIDAEGYWYILGRSDDTIKVAGKRLGPAEPESAAVAHPAVAEAAAIGVPDMVKGEALLVFCVLRPGVDSSDAVRAEIETAVTRALGKALAPRRVLVVPELPKTRTGKVMRRVIRAAYLGADPGDLSALENAGSLEAITNLQQAEQGPQPG
jgi:acetyl-CoA synthetase